MIKNLLKFFSGKKIDGFTPRFVATVVITEARMNHKMKKGKTFFSENLFFSVGFSEFLFDCLVCKSAKT